MKEMHLYGCAFISMKYPEGTPERGLQRLAVKYGGAAAVLVANNTVVQIAVLVIIYAVIAAIPGGDTLLDRETDAGFLFLIMLNEVVSYTVPLVTLYALFYRELKFEKTVREPPGMLYDRFFGETALLYLGGTFTASCVGIATNIVSGLLNRLFGIPETKTAFSNLMPQDLFCYVWFVAAICFIGPVCEEVIFRHILLRPMRRYGDMTAALMTALLFGLSHFNFDQFLYTFAFGFFLAVITLRSGTVIPAIICHVINNAITVVQVYRPESTGAAALDSVLNSLSDILSLCSVIMMFAGIPALIVIAVTRLLKLKNRSGIPVPKQLAVVLSDPLLIVSVVLSLVLAFADLYIE